MTLIQLFEFLNNNTPHEFYSNENELQQALMGNHKNELIGQMIKLIGERCQCQEVNCEIKREDASGSVS